MKKSILSLTLLFALFLVSPTKAMISTKDMEEMEGKKPTYSQFCIGVENQVEGEKMFVKTLYVPDGEILETTHKQGEEIEFGKTFTVKLKVKDRPEVFRSSYKEEFEKEGLFGNIVTGNTNRNYFFITYNAHGHPEICQGGCGPKGFFVSPIVRPKSIDGFYCSYVLLEKRDK